MSSGQTLAIAAPIIHEWAEHQQHHHSFADDVTETCFDTYFNHYLFRIGIYGWRKRCLYFLVVLLFGLVVLNLSLMVWIIKVMDFTMDGMGNLRIRKDGIRVEGRSVFSQTLYAAEIRSRQDQPLNFESSRNITFSTRNAKGKITNRMYIGDGTMVTLADRFTVQRPGGEILLHVDDHEVVMAADKMRVTGEGGVTFDGSIETSVVKSEPREQLRLESPTRTLKISAPEGVGIESRAGDISATCMKDFELKSREGSIIMESNKLEFKNLRIVIPTSRGRSYPGIYQMCSCENGRLFLSSSEGHCQADESICK